VLINSIIVLCTICMLHEPSSGSKKSNDPKRAWGKGRFNHSSREASTRSTLSQARQGAALLPLLPADPLEHRQHPIQPSLEVASAAPARAVGGVQGSGADSQPSVPHRSIPVVVRFPDVCVVFVYSAATIKDRA